LFQVHKVGKYSRANIKMSLMVGQKIYYNVKAKKVVDNNINRVWFQQFKIGECRIQILVFKADGERKIKNFLS